MKTLIDPTGRLAQFVAPIVEDNGYTLVRVGMTSDTRDGQIVQIMVEPNTKTELNLDDCAELSREIAATFDVEDPVAGQYRLEVSSPGIDRPLTRMEDFDRYAGHEAKIELDRPIPSGQKRFRGILKGTSEDRIVLDTEIDKEQMIVELPFDAVIKARLILTDALLEASKKERELRLQSQSNKTNSTPKE